MICICRWTDTLERRTATTLRLTPRCFRTKSLPIRCGVCSFGCYNAGRRFSRRRRRHSQFTFLSTSQTNTRAVFRADQTASSSRLSPAGRAGRAGTLGRATLAITFLALRTFVRMHLHRSDCRERSSCGGFGSPSRIRSRSCPRAMTVYIDEKPNETLGRMTRSAVGRRFQCGCPWRAPRHRSTLDLNGAP